MKLEKQMVKQPKIELRKTTLEKPVQANIIAEGTQNAPKAPSQTVCYAPQANFGLEGVSGVSTNVTCDEGTLAQLKENYQNALNKIAELREKFENGELSEEEFRTQMDEAQLEYEKAINDLVEVNGFRKTTSTIAASRGESGTSGLTTEEEEIFDDEGRLIRKTTKDIDSKGNTVSAHRRYYEYDGDFLNQVDYDYPGDGTFTYEIYGYNQRTCNMCFRSQYKYEMPYSIDSGLDINTMYDRWHGRTIAEHREEFDGNGRIKYISDAIISNGENIGYKYTYYSEDGEVENTETRYYANSGKTDGYQTKNITEYPNGDKRIEWFNESGIVVKAQSVVTDSDGSVTTTTVEFSTDGKMVVKYTAETVKKNKEKVTATTNYDENGNITQEVTVKRNYRGITTSKVTAEYQLNSQGKNVCVKKVNEQRISNKTVTVTEIFDPETGKLKSRTTKTTNIKTAEWNTRFGRTEILSNEIKDALQATLKLTKGTYLKSNLINNKIKVEINHRDKY